MNAKDVMTTPVVTISPDTRLARIAALLAEHRISGVPVVDRGRVAGIVSERDLLDHREIGAAGPRARAPWWACMFLEAPDPSGYVRSHGIRAQDVMSAPAVTVGGDAPAARILALLDKRRIRRVPVVEGGRLAGIVTRADLPGPPLFCGYLRDMTEARERERDLRRLATEQAALRRVATAVATRTDPRHTFAVVTEEVGRLLGAQSSNMVRFDDGLHATVVGAWNEGGVQNVPVGDTVRMDGDTASTRRR